MTVAAIPDQGLLAEIEALIAKTDAAIKRCEETRKAGLSAQEKAQKRCDEAYQRVCLALHNCTHYVQVKVDEYEAGKRNFTALASFDSLRSLKRVIEVVTNFLLHHEHTVYNVAYTKTYNCAPASQEPDFVRAFFTGELKEHTKRVGGMQVYDPEKMAKILGRR